MRSVGRGELTDQQWRQIESLLPAQKPRIGRPSKDHRTINNGLQWVLRTGAPWRDLPEVYGSWSTVASRFYRWRRKGLWERLLSDLQQEADVAGELEWEVHFVDGTIVRAHQHAAGAKKGAETRR